MERRSQISRVSALINDSDYFLETIKAKGFAYGQDIAQLRQSPILSLEELSHKIESHLLGYLETKQSQPFANFIIQRLLQDQTDLSQVE